MQKSTQEQSVPTYPTPSDRTRDRIHNWPKCMTKLATWLGGITGDADSQDSIQQMAAALTKMRPVDFARMEELAKTQYPKVLALPLNPSADPGQRNSGQLNAEQVKKLISATQPPLQMADENPTPKSTTLIEAVRADIQAQTDSLLGNTHPIRCLRQDPAENAKAHASLEAAVKLSSALATAVKSPTQFDFGWAALRCNPGEEPQVFGRAAGTATASSIKQWTINPLENCGLPIVSVEATAFPIPVGKDGALHGLIELAPDKASIECHMHILQGGGMIPLTPKGQAVDAAEHNVKLNAGIAELIIGHYAKSDVSGPWSELLADSGRWQPGSGNVRGTGLRLCCNQPPMQFLPSLIQAAEGCASGLRTSLEANLRAGILHHCSSLSAIDSTGSLQPLTLALIWQVQDAHRACMVLMTDQTTFDGLLTEATSLGMAARVGPMPWRWMQLRRDGLTLDVHVEGIPSLRPLLRDDGSDTSAYYEPLLYSSNAPGVVSTIDNPAYTQTTARASILITAGGFIRLPDFHRLTWFQPRDNFNPYGDVGWPVFEICGEVSPTVGAKAFKLLHSAPDAAQEAPKPAAATEGEQAADRAILAACTSPEAIEMLKQLCKVPGNQALAASIEASLGRLKAQSSEEFRKTAEAMVASFAK